MLKRLLVLGMGLGLALMTTSCGPKKPILVITPKQPAPSVTLAPPPRKSRALMALVEQARVSEDVTDILPAFDVFILGDDPVLRDEARYRRVQVMLEKHVPGAYREAQIVLTELPGHALAPYARYWLARWWAEQDDHERALQELEGVLRHPALTAELAERALSLGASSSQRVEASEAVAWLLTAASLDVSRREDWLRLASRRINADDLPPLHERGDVDPALLAELDVQLARRFLIQGRMDLVSRIDDWLAGLPAPEAWRRQVHSWTSGVSRAARIGVLLPLTGTYARYGRAALRGMRMALAEGQEQAVLRIEDTGGDPGRCVTAYERLHEENVDIIVGPLLKSSAEALAGHLHGDIPVIALTNAVDLAGNSPALFVHTLSPLAQAQFIAAYALEHGAHRFAVLELDRPGSRQEGDRFAQMLAAMGGEVLDTLVLPADEIDVRDRLRELKMRTDDEMRLADLDEELSIFLPEAALEPRVPTMLDALYLAMPGRRVALIAGQLAYSDLTGISLFGSSLWDDGHLLDDRGRYLTRARFARPAQDASVESRLRELRFLYRQVWGKEQPSKLSLLAYDTARLAIVVAGRLGLSGRQAIRALHDQTGFPAVTGEVTFDAHGAGQKRMIMYRIIDGELMPAS
ncbi:MAG: penicillin-binding protein activator [Zetaproteobacteria bacterium]|nr:MAG: penicillin-binding protein activator [Zetaproteobacteria bacterium]